MNQPVRKRTDADATETNQLDVTGIFCGKLLSCPAIIFGQAPGIGSERQKCEVFILPAVARHSGVAAIAKLRGWGTSGRVKLYGRLGWMGACAEYSLDGEGFTAPTYIGREGSPNVQNGLQFF